LEKMRVKKMAGVEEDAMDRSTGQQAGMGSSRASETIALRPSWVGMMGVVVLSD
jgi:hypothetical protein